MKKLFTLLLFTIVVFLKSTISFSQCAVIYASPTGSALNDGSESNPMDLQTAISQACSANRKHVRLFSGTYTINSKIVVGCDDLIIDGDWEVNAGVGQKNSSLTTVVNIDSPLEVANYDGAAGTLVGYYIGIEAIATNNLRIQDITFHVKNGGTSGVATGTTGFRGTSVYGFYFRNSNGWVLERCEMNTGAGSQGASGTNSIASANGSNAGNGSTGDCDDDCYINNGGAGGFGAGAVPAPGVNIDPSCGSTSGPGQNGAAGTSAGVFRSGGGGGSGGTAGAENNAGGSGGSGGNGGGGALGATTGGGAGAGYGSNGGGNCTTGDGRAGANGVNGAPGANGTPLAISSNYNFFWEPSGQSSTGLDGAGGSGGRGGGGGGGQGCFFCIDGTGSAGGGGGGGGQGGLGATGGWGAGGTFALYQYGGSGIRNNTTLNSGPVAVGGIGGVGANGGTGGNGGLGGGGNNTSTTTGCAITGARVCGNSEVGAGGRGGNGGNGGKGGDGGAGANGVSAPVQLVGGASAPASTTPAISQVIANKPLEGCTNSEIIITKDGGTWTLTGSGTYVQNLNASTSSYSNASPTALVSYSTTGAQSIDINGVTYDGFIMVNTNRPLPIFHSSMSTTICEGDNFTMNTPTSGSEYEWVIFNASSNTASPTAIFTTSVASWSTPITGVNANYSVRLRVRENCCGWSAPVYFNFSVVTTTVGPIAVGASICENDTATISATGTGAGNLVWYSDALGQIVLQSTAGATSAFITDPLTQSTVFYVSESIGGCLSALTSVNVAVAPAPLTPTTTNVSACEGSSVNLQGTGSGTGDLVFSDNAMLTVATVPMTTGANQTHNLGALLAGTYTYFVSENNGTCSSDATPISVVVNAPAGTPTISITSSATAICDGSNVTFTASSTIGGSNPMYQWFVNGAAVGSNNAVYATANLVNGDIVTAEITSDAFCLVSSMATSNSIVMVVNPSVSPSISIAASATTICNGTSVTFTATPSNSGTTPIYDWFVNGVSQATNATTFVSSALVNGDIVSASMVSDASCATPTSVNSNAISINVNSSLTPTISIAASDLTICNGESVTFTASIVNGGSNPTIQWFVNGAPVGSNNSTFTSSTIMNGDLVTAQLTSDLVCATSATAASNTLSMTVTPNVNPLISINTYSTSICSGANVTFTATASNTGAGPIYDWYVNGVSQGVNATSFASSTLVNGDVVTASLISNSPCASISFANSNSITMVVNSSLTPTISIAASAATICDGESVTFTASITNGGFNPIIQWFVNGNPVGSNNSTFTTSILANGDVVNAQLTSDLSCATSATATSGNLVMNVESSAVPMAFISTPQTVFCAGQSITITSATTNGGATPGYNWYLNGVSTGVTTANYTSTTFMNGDVISLLFTSSSNCASPNQVVSNSITMIESSSSIASVSISSLNGTLCENQSVTFIATPTNATSNLVYQWMVNGANVGSNSAAFATSNLNAGDQVSLVLTYDNACGVTQTTTSNTLSITAVPIVNAGLDLEILSGETVQLNGQSSVAGAYTWSPNQFLDDANILNPTSNSPNTIEYTLTVTSVDGCTGMDAIVISVNSQDVNLPNSFTPNEDGTNDVWNIANIELYPTMSLQIFNRWGNLIYDQSNTYVPWDGKFKGNPLPSETYFYILQLDANSEILKGSVTIVR